MARGQAATKTAAEPKKLATYQAKVVTSPWYKTLDDGTERANIDTFVKSRRIGGSVAAAYRGALWAMGLELQANGTAIVREPMDVIVVSKDFTSSKRLLKEVADACLDLARADPKFEPDIQATSIKLANGRTIEALACSARAIRGPTAGVIADEFAFWRQQEDCWAAIKSVTDPTWKTKKGQPALFVTTAWDSASLACRIFTDPAFPFERHSVDIYEAAAAGFPINPEQVFRELGIPELIDSEYLCRWTRGGESFFPRDKLIDCQEHDQKSRGGDTIKSGLPEDWRRAPLYVGIDVGGGKGRDMTAIVLVRLIDGIAWIVGVIAFNRKEPTDQWDEIERLIKAHADESVRVQLSVDAGFGGNELMSEMRKRFRNWRRLQVSGVTMDPANQERLAKRARKLLDHDKIRIYTGADAGGDEGGAHAMVLELSSLKTRPGTGGRLVLVTPRDSTKGHCDRAWAAMFGLSRIGASITQDEAAAAQAAELAAGAPPPPPKLITYDSPGNF